MKKLQNIKSKIKNIYILGDSSSDEGSLINCLNDMVNNFPIKNKKLLNSFFFKNIKNIEEYHYILKLDENHYNGVSFTDGPTAIRIIANKLNLNLTPSYETKDINILGVQTKIETKIGNNFAIVGAVSNFYYPTFTKNFSDFLKYLTQPFYVLARKVLSDLNKNSTILDQTEWLLNQNNDLSESLIFISIGTNDILNLDLILTTKITSQSFNDGIEYLKKSNKNIKKSINDLIKNNVKNIVILNVCDVTLTPRFSKITDEVKLFYSKLIYEFNIQLLKNITEINIKNKKIICHIFDLYKSFNKIYNKAILNNIIVNVPKFRRTIFDFEVDKNKKIIYITSKVKRLNSNKKNEYLFWDSIHPSKWTHNEVANRLIKFLDTIEIN